MINKPPPLYREYNRDPNIKARKRRGGFMNHGSTLGVRVGNFQVCMSLLQASHGGTGSLRLRRPQQYSRERSAAGCGRFSNSPESMSISSEGLQNFFVIPRNLRPQPQTLNPMYFARVFAPAGTWLLPSRKRRCKRKQNCIAGTARVAE